jgi:hypothetical protein
MLRHAAADACTDSGANARADDRAYIDTASHIDADGFCELCREDRRTNAHTGDHIVADTDTWAGVSESRARGARVVRFGRDDRFRSVDLATLLELTSSKRPNRHFCPTP